MLVEVKIWQTVFLLPTLFFSCGYEPKHNDPGDLFFAAMMRITIYSFTVKR